MFYLIYTDVKYWKRDPYKIAYNYLVTAPSIEGLWSEPVFLNSSGFDPSLFHAFHELHAVLALARILKPVVVVVEFGLRVGFLREAEGMPAVNERAPGLSAERRTTITLSGAFAKTSREK